MCIHFAHLRHSNKVAAIEGVASRSCPIMRVAHVASSRWTVLPMALAMQTAISVVTAAMAVLFAFIKKEFHLTYAEEGVGANFSFIGGTLATALAGLAVDAFGNFFVLVVWSIVTGTAVGAAAISRNLWVLLAMLVVVGVGASSQPLEPSAGPASTSY